MRLDLVAITVAALVLSACGGGGGGGGEEGSAPAVEGAVVKGPVTGATVCAYALKDGAKDEKIPLDTVSGRIVDGCYVTRADGRYAVTLPLDTQGDVLIEATGGRFCSNESQVASGACSGGGSLLSLDGTVMRSVVATQANGTATVYTTPLTTAAVANTGSRVTATRFGTAFTALAGSIIGPSSAVTPATAPTTTTQPYLAQVATFLAGGGTLSSAVSSLAKGTTTFTASPGNDTKPATVNADFVGTRELVFKTGGGEGCAGTGCNYQDGDKLTFVIHGDSRLTLPNGKILTAPFNRAYGGTLNTHEIIWYDASAKIEYALSDNTGAFNEINVGDMAKPTSNGLPRFLGQLRTPTNDTLSALTKYAGTYQRGFQYSGAEVTWTSVTIGSDGAITFNGGPGPNVKPADILEVTDRVGCCGSIDVTINRDLNTPANGIDGSDRISLSLDEDGQLRSIRYDLANANVIDDDTGVRLGAVAALKHSGRDVPTTGRIVDGTVSGNKLRLAPSTSSSVNTMGMSLFADGGPTGPSWMLQVNTGTLAKGDYECYAGGTLVQATLQPGAFPVSTRNGGRCTITITKLEMASGAVTVLEGRFVAEMFDGGRQNQAPKIVRDGVFRWTPATN